MKVPRNQKDSDLLCQKSMNFLTSRVKNFLEKNFKTDNFWVPNDFSSWTGKESHKIDPQNPLHIILYGNPLRSILESEYWNHEKIHLWTISNTTKNLILKTTGLDDKQISVIPRQCFVNLNSEIQSVNQLSFFSSGRISRQKNIDFNLLVIFFLQKISERKVVYKHYGNFDNDYDPLNGRFEWDGEFKAELDSLIGRLDWENPPQFIHDLDQNEWLDYLNEGDCYLSTSKFCMEDFSVSLAQIEEEGFPFLVSEWGGQLEVIGQNGHFIPTSLCPDYHFPMGLKMAMAKNLAEKVLQGQLKKAETKKIEISLSKPLNSSDIKEMRMSLQEKLGLSALHILHDNYPLFFDTKEGRTIASVHKKSFENSEDKLGCILFVVDQLGVNNQRENDEIFSKAYELLKEGEFEFQVIDKVMAFNGIDSLLFTSSHKIFYTSLINDKVAAHLGSMGAVQLKDDRKDF